MLPIAGQTAVPIGLKFFVESGPRMESSLSAEWNARFIPDKIKE